MPEVNFVALLRKADNSYDKLNEFDFLSFQNKYSKAVSLKKLNEALDYFNEEKSDTALSIIKTVVHKTMSYDALSVLLMFASEDELSITLDEMSLDKIHKIDKVTLYESVKYFMKKRYNLRDVEQFINNFETLLNHQHFSLVDGQTFDKDDDYTYLFNNFKNSFDF